MSFIAGYLLGLSDSGSKYTDEEKEITENGDYAPESDVRWSKVTVNVPDDNLLGEINALRTFETIRFSDFLIEIKEPLRSGDHLHYIATDHTTSQDFKYIQEYWELSWNWYPVYIIDKRYAVISYASCANDYRDYLEYIGDTDPSGSYQLFYSSTNEFTGISDLNFQPNYYSNRLPYVDFYYLGEHTDQSEYSKPANNRTSVSTFKQSAYIDGNSYYICTDMTVDEMKQMIKGFVTAASQT